MTDFTCFVVYKAKFLNKKDMEFSSNIINQAIILIDVIIALLLGGILGAEREWKRKPAGLRTNMIIAGSAALFVALGRVIVVDYTGLSTQDEFGVDPDPIRMLHAVIVGVSFIGAGTILKSNQGSTIKYLTTSATILMAAAIGISVALKQYALAVSTAFIVLFINYIFDGINRFIHQHSDFSPPQSEEESEDGGKY